MATSFVLIHKQPKDAERNRQTLAFFRWALANGQELAGSLNYVPLPAPLVQRVESLLAGAGPMTPARSPFFGTRAARDADYPGGGRDRPAGLVLSMARLTISSPHPVTARLPRQWQPAAETSSYGLHEPSGHLPGSAIKVSTVSAECCFVRPLNS